MNLADILDQVEEFAAQFVAFPSEETRTAFVLWAAHTHVVDAFESTPRLALLSPEPGSGKTRAMEILELLVPRPWFTTNTSSAALFRSMADEAGIPTVLLDEADTVFGPRAAKEHEDLRGLINSGHRRGASTKRCVFIGKTIAVEDFPSFAPVALAGLDDLPPTIMTRSLVIRMRRRAPHEIVLPFRRRLHGGAGEELRELLAQHLQAVAGHLEAAYPDMPEGVTDRDADCWEPLLAIADEAGSHWPERARVSSVSLVTANRGGGETFGIRLLSDLRGVFDRLDVAHLPTVDLIVELNGLEDAPWGGLRSGPLDSRELAKRLKRYGVTPLVYRVGKATTRGYARTDLLDPWTRYLLAPTAAAPLPPENAVTGVTSETPTAAVDDDCNLPNNISQRCVKCAGALYEADRIAGSDTCSDCELHR